MRLPEAGMIRYERERDTLVAITRTRVGSGEIGLSVELGPWDGPDPEAAGLRGLPVVVVPDPSLTARAAQGVRLSGRVEPALITGGDAASFGAQLLRSEAVAAIVETDDGAVLAAVRALGGRPLAALPFPDADAIRGLVDACPVDLDLAIPSLEPARSLAREVLLDLALEERHHVIEADPRPAFDDPSGTSARGATAAELTAAAAGVLAGRVAAGNERWHRSLG